MYQTYLKRLLAIVLSLLGILLLSWLFLILFIAIKVDDPGPIFFKQKRVGKDKTYFNILKFRTMKVDTPHDMPTHLLANPDQYITRVGCFLRKTSLDELPQFFNILKGDMAIIGPRPALWNQYDLIAERDKYGANDVRPGLTGWAQIHGRDELEIDVKAQLDGYYVQHISFWMDVKCFFGTIAAVLKHDGVVEGGTGAMHDQAERRKKILILTNHSYMLYRFRRELIAALMEEHEVVLSMPFVGHEDDFQAMGLRCIETGIDRRGVNPVTDWKLMRAYHRMLKEERPDLVITYSIKPNIYGGLACARLGIPFCANVQGLGTAFQKPLLAGFVTALYRTAFRKVQTVFFENETNAREFRERGILAPEKQVVLHGAGINLEEYPCTPYAAHEPVHFLYLGRIMREKGMDELFSAMRRLHGEELPCVLDLVGFFEDEYKEQVEALERDGIAVYHGFQEEPRPFYAAADCVVMPSYHEGLSNVLLEAAAMGRPVITTDIPGCREAVEDGKTGLLCQVKDGEDLYRAMKSFLALTAEQREALGLAGREKMETEFSKELVVADTMAALGLGVAAAV